MIATRLACLVPFDQVDLWALRRLNGSDAESFKSRFCKEGGVPTSGLDGRVPALGYVIPFDEGGRLVGACAPGGGCGLSEASSEHRASDAIQRVLVNVQGGIGVGQEQLESGKIIPIKRHGDGYICLFGAVLGLTFGVSEGSTGTGSSPGALHGEEVGGLIVVYVFHGGTLYRHCDVNYYDKGALKANSVCVRTS